MRKTDLDIIEVKWEGPFPVEEVRRFKGPKDYGIYQVYGTHSIYGSDVLLYIGKANKMTFADRFNSHEKWIDDESGPITIYVGRFGGSKQPSNTEWEKQINQAEGLLLYFATPPYNLKQEPIDHNKSTIVMNFYRCHKLPLVVTNLWENSGVWLKRENEWDEYRWSENKNKLSRTKTKKK